MLKILSILSNYLANCLLNWRYFWQKMKVIWHFRPYKTKLFTEESKWLMVDKLRDPLYWFQISMTKIRSYVNHIDYFGKKSLSKIYSLSNLIIFRNRHSYHICTVSTFPPLKQLQLFFLPPIPYLKSSPLTFCSDWFI